MYRGARGGQDLRSDRGGKDKILKSGYDGGQEPTIIPEDIMPRKVTPEDLKKELKAAV